MPFSEKELAELRAHLLAQLNMAQSSSIQTTKLIKLASRSPYGSAVLGDWLARYIEENT